MERSWQHFWPYTSHSLVAPSGDSCPLSCISWASQNPLLGETYCGVTARLYCATAAQVHSVRLSRLRLLQSSSGERQRCQFSIVCLLCFLPSQLLLPLLLPVYLPLRSRKYQAMLPSSLVPHAVAMNSRLPVPRLRYPSFCRKC